MLRPRTRKCRSLFRFFHQMKCDSEIYKDSISSVEYSPKYLSKIKAIQRIRAFGNKMHVFVQFVNSCSFLKPNYFSHFQHFLLSSIYKKNLNILKKEKKRRELWKLVWSHLGLSFIVFRLPLLLSKVIILIYYNLKCCDCSFFNREHTQASSYIKSMATATATTCNMIFNQTKKQQQITQKQ